MKLGMRIVVPVASMLVLGLLRDARAQKPPMQPRPITIDDLFQIREVQDPQLSSDARWIAYTIKATSVKEDNTQERIWIVSAAGGDEIPLTAEGVSSSHPRWSPDGKYLAFLSARQEGKTEIWLLNRMGGSTASTVREPST